jgi:hypothetical protein
MDGERMGCEHVSFKDEEGREVRAIICSRGRKPKSCSVPFCGNASVALCDYPVERKGKPGTCDSPMCERHRHPVLGQADTDWCDGHWHHEQRLSLPMGDAGSHAEPAGG